MEKNNVYREKRHFVEALKPALTMLPGIDDVEYHFFSDKYSEYVRVIWEDGHKDFITVSGNSLEAILHELTRLITGDNPTGLIENALHKVSIDAWFESADIQ